MVTINSGVRMNCTIGVNTHMPESPKLINEISNPDTMSGPICRPEFHLCLLGSEIPELFSYWSEGSTISWPPPLCLPNDELIGISMCVVMSISDSLSEFNIVCHFGNHGFEFYPRSDLKGDDHLCLAYFSKNTLYCNKDGEYDYGQGVTARFEILEYENRKKEYSYNWVKRCGIRAIYKQDVEYLKELSATDGAITMSSTLQGSRFRKCIHRIKKEINTSNDHDDYSEDSSVEEVDIGIAAVINPIPLFSSISRHFYSVCLERVRVKAQRKKKMLWVDKYRPKTLDQVIVHQDIALNLKKLVTEQDCPHLLFYGPSGSGKKTLIMALLRQVFGPGAEKVKVENRTWKIDAGSRTIDLELTTLSSANHVELSPSDVGFQDRYIVQEIIKEMAKNRPIDTKGKRGYKVLVLNEVDKLSREAQHSLRRTMEKYSTSCRLILCCNSSSKVIEAIRSRCLNVRINAPTEEQIVKVLEFIGKKEGLQLPSGFAARIAEKSNRSLRRAILSFETCRVQQYPFTSNQAIPPMDWEEYVSEIASDIMKEQSPKRLFQVRGKLYELLTNCIPPEIVLKRLLYELLKRLDAELKHEICHWAAYYEHRMRLGQKAIFHLEGVHIGAEARNVSHPCKTNADCGTGCHCDPGLKLCVCPNLFAGAHVSGAALEATFMGSQVKP
ncbi:hypothetical protein LWI29_022863 [Acer saccharum]|uniref:AAA+ ATPase domain-containing protein n=1 Tax=Acer saccharum TaxID=4024 RepID=A0AA39T412_ACESA|nr:hypothetical protein LWI29_022863 [Acer saccharum]